MFVLLDITILKLVTAVESTRSFIIVVFLSREKVSKLESEKNKVVFYGLSEEFFICLPRSYEHSLK